MAQNYSLKKLEGTLLVIRNRIKSAKWKKRISSYRHKKIDFVSFFRPNKMARTRQSRMLSYTEIDALSLCCFQLGSLGYLIGSVTESPGILAHFNTSSTVKYQMKAEVVPFPKHHQAWGGDIMRRRTISAKVDQQCKCADNWWFVSRRQNISRRTYVSYN